MHVVIKPIALSPKLSFPAPVCATLISSAGRLRLGKQTFLEKTFNWTTFWGQISAPFVEMPDAFKRQQQHLLKYSGSDREMAEILTLVLQHDETAFYAPLSSPGVMARQLKRIS